MKNLRVFEIFAGIGSQHKALENIFKNQNLLKEYGLEKKGYKIQYISEWYIDGIISYDAIHYGSQEGYKTPSKEEMLNFIKTFSLSRDSKNPITEISLNRLKEDKIKQLYIALKRTNNLGSILDIKGDNIQNIDLLTYSFPCQDLSIAGKKAGIKKGENTRSGLLWEIERVLKEINTNPQKKLPRFLLMENVKALLQNQFLNDFKEFEKFLESLGYMNTRILLDATDFGIPQKRERVFLISELHGKTHFQIQKTQKPSCVGDFLKWDKKNKINCSKEDKNDIEQFILKDTKARRGYLENTIQLDYNSPYTRTLTTKQDRNRNAGNVKFKNNLPGKLQFRFLTPRETLLLMGFDNLDYEKLKKMGISNAEIYKQAGNSIVVNVLEAIFLEILKRF